MNNIIQYVIPIHTLARNNLSEEKIIKRFKRLSEGRNNNIYILYNITQLNIKYYTCTSINNSYGSKTFRDKRNRPLMFGKGGGMVNP